MVKLGVNIDHVATLRQARMALVPDPVEAAILCEEAGCDSIVCHLREDRRHINDDDVKRLRLAVKTRLNLEMSVAREIVEIARRIKPEQATLVPERRLEVTTEGGLDVVKLGRRVKNAVGALHKSGIQASLFINPAASQIEAAFNTGAKIIEFHTGEYANARSVSARKRQLLILVKAVRCAVDLGLEVNAGHGLDYENAADVARIPGMHELNIGHSIIARAIFTGLNEAVEEMLGLIR